MRSSIGERGSRLRHAALTPENRRHLREAGMWILGLVASMGGSLSSRSPSRQVDRWLERAVDKAYREGKNYIGFVWEFLAYNMLLTWRGHYCGEHGKLSGHGSNYNHPGREPQFRTMLWNVCVGDHVGPGYATTGMVGRCTGKMALFLCTVKTWRG